MCTKNTMQCKKGKMNDIVFAIGGYNAVQLEVQQLEVTMQCKKEECIFAIRGSACG